MTLWPRSDYEGNLYEEVKATFRMAEKEGFASVKSQFDRRVETGSPSTGYDTLILALARGRGYQWLDCYGYSHPLASAARPAGQLPTDYSSERSTLVPTGTAFIDAAGPVSFAGHLVFCTFNGGMRIVTPVSPHASVRPGPSGCRLDVKGVPTRRCISRTRQRSIA